MSEWPQTELDLLLEVLRDYILYIVISNDRWWVIEFINMRMEPEPIPKLIESGKAFHLLLDKKLKEMGRGARGRCFCC